MTVTKRDLEMETALATQKHIELCLAGYTRSECMDIFRGRIKAFAAAYGSLCGARHAFQLWSDLADAEVFLQLPPNCREDS